jgi:hypothetical protein
VDPTGVRADGRKIIDVSAVRTAVVLKLAVGRGTVDGKQETENPEVVHAAA